MPGGTVAQPPGRVSPASTRYCGPVAQRTYSHAVSLSGAFGDGQGPRPQPAGGVGDLGRRQRVAELALDGAIGCLEVARRDRGVVPHGGLAIEHLVGALVVAGVGGVVLAGVVDEVDVELQGFLELGLIDLRSADGVVLTSQPPRPTERVQHGGEERRRGHPNRAWPRRQIPAISGVSMVRAISATSSQVGASGMVMPAASRTSLRYIRNDDSP